MLRDAIALRVGVVTLVVATVACGAESRSHEGVLVVATTTVLGDIAANVVGGAGHVEVLIPRGADPHEFRASSQQAAMVLRADLVVVNALGLEDGLLDLIDATAADGANVLELGPLLDPLPQAGGAADDPHVWMDPIRVAAGARIIADALAAAVPGVPWRESAARYGDALEAADREIRAILATLPNERRKLVTNHDALGYYAARYDLSVVGVVIPGGATTASSSSSQLAELVATIALEGVPAIFAGTIEPTTLALAVADEMGEAVEVVQLYTGSLGETGSGAETLIDMLIVNARRIVAALG